MTGKRSGPQSSSPQHLYARHPMAATCASQFLATTAEQPDLNQYWYSKASIDTVRSLCGLKLLKAFIK